MVIFGAPKASSELRCASKWLLTFDFEALEASGVPKGDQESPKKLPRSPQEAPTRLLGGALGALGGPRSIQKSPQATILDTFIVFRASKSPPRRSPSHDLSTMSTFWSLQKGDDPVIRTRGPGPAGPLDTLAQAPSDLYYKKTRSKRRCSLLTGGSADSGI